MNPFTVWNYSDGKLKLTSDLVRVCTTKYKGRGMCAKQDIPGGTVIIREACVLSCNDTPKDIFAAYQGLTDIQAKMIHTLKHTKTLECAYQRFRSVMCNAVRTDGVYSLYMSGGFLNHSCYPNAYATSFMGIMTVVTLGFIPEGTEISISYSTWTLGIPLSVRSGIFAKRYTWKCMCELCGESPGWTTKERLDTSNETFKETCELGREKFQKCIQKYSRKYSGHKIERVIDDFHTTMTVAGEGMGYKSESDRSLDIRQHKDLDIKNVNMNPLVYIAVCCFINFLETGNRKDKYFGKTIRDALLSMLDYAIVVAEVRFEQFTDTYISHVLLKCVLLREL